MENTSLVALSRQLALRHKLDVIANNVANINTAGFKRQSLEMDEYVMPTAAANTFPRRDRTHSFVEDWATTTDYESGSIEVTGNPLDVAIKGDAFFVVNTPEGERFTRAGNFQLDNDGRLVTADGKPVMSEAGEVVFGPTETDIVIGADGSIATNAGQRGRLRLVQFEDNRILKKIGDNLYEGENANPAEGVRVQQGAIEMSNVQGVIEMTRLIDVTRTYEQVSNLVRNLDELRSKAIQRLGDLRA